MLVVTRPLGRPFAPGVFSSSVSTPFGQTSHRFAQDLTIDADDAQTLRSLLGRLRAVELADTEARRRFDLALTRLNTAAQRASIEDRLIDYWIALETLFAHDGRAEISYRARTRVARYISDNIDERKQIAQTLSRSYDRRSKVVHGDKPKADLAGLTTETGEILRRALRRMLESGEAIDVEMLDLG